MVVRKSVLSSDPEQAREQVEAIARAFSPPYEYEPGKQLRSLAVELVKQEGLGVRFVSHEDGSQELEVFLASDPERETAIITRTKDGNRCQITWERWADIRDDLKIRNEASVVAAVMNGGTCAKRGQMLKGRKEDQQA
jgi:hypothetical protein